jgi:uncharacterized ferritin-like protein (DUF455 family)
MIAYDEYAKKILQGESLEDKLFQAPIDWTSYQDFNLPAAPGRKGTLKFSEDRLKFPKALHSFANHELLAIEMMAAALLVYPHKSEEDLRFKKGIVTALKDEQKHLSLYIGRLHELGFEFGDFPLNNFFWRQMEKLKTPNQYAAMMALTFEAANLDFAQYYKGVFQSVGDEQTAQILQTVLEDEISHVAFGSFWLKKWRQDKSLWEYYLSSLPGPMTPMRSKGIGFDRDLHAKAMGDDEFIDQLAKYEDDFRVTKRS